MTRTAPTSREGRPATCRRTLVLIPHRSRTSDAVAFAISGTQLYHLTQFRFAANWFAGTNSINVGLYVESDLNTASLLESFTFSANAQATAQLFTAVSVKKPTLIPGNTYFIALSVDPSTTWGWQWNDQGQTGGWFARSGTGAWIAESATTPAFEVSATPTSAEDAFVVKLGTQSADVSVTSFANPSPVLSGSNLAYTITAFNNGPDLAL